MEQDQGQDMIRVFVYGTLKKGEGNHRLLQGRALFCGEDSIHGKLFDLGAFPAAVQEGDNVIHGEVYMVGPHTLRSLDGLEGHPHFYERKEVMLLNEKKLAWAYFLPDAKVYRGSREVEGGVWSRRTRVNG